LDRFREALFRADRRPPFLADLARFAPLRALFLAPLRADFLLARLAALLAVFLRGRLGLAVRSRLGVGSSNWLYDDGVEAGVGEGVLSIGSGSIHPEPDQPISMK
jgi:hypothetical protein